MTDMQIVQGIYGIGGSAFIVLLCIGALTTMARVLYYARNRTPRPRLLNRDVVVIGGLALSFALIVFVRFLPIEQRIALTTGNIAWALVTTLPGTLAAAVYVWFEAFVVKRGVR